MVQAKLVSTAESRPVVMSSMSTSEGSASMRVSVLSYSDEQANVPAVPSVRAPHTIVLVSPVRQTSETPGLVTAALAKPALRKGTMAAARATTFAVCFGRAIITPRTGT